MKIIKTKVIGDTITPIEQGYVIENQVNQYAIEFDFDETWNFQEKYVIFQDQFEEQTFKRAVINNQVIVPSELLNGRITIQVYGQNIEDNVISQRQPSLKYVFSILNSLPANASEEQNVPTPTQWEIYIEQIETLVDDMCDQFQEIKAQVELNTEDIGKAQQDIKDLQDRATEDESQIQENKNEISNIKRDYSLITETGNKLSVSIDSNYLMTITLKDKNNNILSTASVDFPIESAIINATYNNTTKEITFTLQNGNTLVVPIGDIISGLASQSDLEALTNRVQTIESDYLTSADKTELQGQITDLGNTIETEQTIQDNEIERLQRIVSGLPTKNASGTSFVLNDMVNCEIKEISLKGDTLQDGTPTPSSPIEVQTVKGNQEINFLGKNLFNPTLYEDNKYQNYSPTNTSIANNNNFWITGYQLIKPNTTYTKSSLVTGGVIYDKNKNSLQTLAGNAYTFTTPDNAYYVCFTIPKTSLSFNGNIQLELGDTATDYEPFKQTTKTISLGNIELNKIGNYQDKIYKQNDKWYLEKNVGKYTFTGQEGWRYLHGEANQDYVFQWEANTNTLNIPVGANPTECLSNKFTSYGRTSVELQDYGISLYHYGSWNYTRIYIRNKDITDVDVFKTWLSQNNVDFYYQLATPVTTEITDENLIEQLEALNNYILLTNNTIISNGSLPVINDITGYVDIMSLLSSQNSRNVVEEKKSIEEPIEEPKEDER